MHDALRFVESCIDRYAEQAWRTAYVMLSNAADADDLLQQAFIVAWRKAGSAPRDNTWPWLAAIIANEARNFRRKRARRRGVSLQSIGEPAMQNDPDKRLQRAELAALVHVSLASLSEEQRIAIVLTHLSGLSQSQAADALGVPLNTLKARVRRGLESLRDALGKNAPDLESTLKGLPVSAPPGGFIAAKAAWTANLGVHVATAGTTVAAGIGASKIALTAAVTVLVLGAVAVAAVVLQPKESPKAAVSTKLEAKAPVRQSRNEQPGVDPRSESDSRTPREPAVNACAGQPGTSPPVPTTAPTVAKPDIQPSHKPVWPKTSYETLPADEPPVVRLSGARASGTDSSRHFWEIWRDKKSTCLEKWNAVLKLMGGRDFVDECVEVFESDVWQYRALVLGMIQAVRVNEVLRQLEKFLFNEEEVARHPDAAEHILWGLYNNWTWASDKKKWDKAEDLVTAKKVPDNVKARMIRELGVYRSTWDRPENLARENIRILVELLKWAVEDKKAPALRGLILNSLENLTDHDFGDDRAKWKAFIRHMNDEEDLTPRLATKSTDEFKDVAIESYSYDSPTPRTTEMEVLVLPDLGYSSRYWHPFLNGLNKQFKLSYLDLPDCSRMQGVEWKKDTDGKSDAAYYYPLEQLVEVLEQRRKARKQKKIGLIAHGFSGWIALEYLRLHPESVAFAVIVQSWSGEVSRERARFRMEQDKDDAFECYARSLVDDPSGRTGRLSLNDEQKFLAETGRYKRRWSDPNALETIFYAQPDWRRQISEKSTALIPHYDFSRVANGEHISVPTLFINGAKDPMCPRQDDKASYRKVFTRMTWEDYKNSSDVPWAEEPTRFMDDVQKLLDANRVIEQLKKSGGRH